MSLEMTIEGVASRALPQAVADNTKANLRLGRYQEAYVACPIPTTHTLADEGGYFVTTNPTLGTALAYAVITAFSDTAAAMVFQNNEAISDQAAKRLYLNFVRLVVTVAPASATQAYWAMKIDNVSRVPTANLSLLTAANPNMDVSNSPIARVWAASGGSLTVPASGGSARIVGRGGLGGLPIAGDELVVNFGGIDMPGAGTSATACRKVSHAAPIIIGPQQFAVLYLWFPGNAVTALSFELDAGWWER